MKVQLIALLTAIMIFGITLACTSDSKVKTITDKKDSVPAVTAPAGHDSTAWEKMDHEERVQFMRQEVLPKMRQLFAEFDPKEYPRINCKTCHGEGVTNETFEMPNPKLPKLPATSEGFAELMKKDSAAMNFMMHKVKPTMAKLLEIPEFNPETNPKGFGCMNCHTTKK